MAGVEQVGVERQRTGGTGFWAAERWDPLAPLAGVVSVVLLIAATVMIDGADSPEDGAAPQEYVTYFADEQDAIFISALLFGFAMMAFLWFAASLKARIAAAESTGRLSSLSLVAAAGMAVLIYGAVGFEVSGAIALDEEVALAPEAAQALFWASDGMFVFAWFMAAVFLLAVGVATLRTGLLPRWLGIVTVIMAVLLPWWFVAWAVFFFLFPIWIVVVAVLLWRHPAGERPASP